MKGQIIQIQDAYELADWYQQSGELKKAHKKLHADAKTNLGLYKL